VTNTRKVGDIVFQMPDELPDDDDITDDNILNGWELRCVICSIDSSEKGESLGVLAIDRPWRRPRLYEKPILLSKVNPTGNYEEVDEYLTPVSTYDPSVYFDTLEEAIMARAEKDIAYATKELARANKVKEILLKKTAAANS